MDLHHTWESPYLVHFTRYMDSLSLPSTFTYSATAQGIFDCLTSTFPCRWAFVLLLGQAYRLVQCRQLLLNTNQLPSCQEHPVSPELDQRAGIEPAFMDRWDLIPTRESTNLLSHTQPKLHWNYQLLNSLALASTSATIHTTTEGIEPSSLTRQASALHA